MQKIATAIADVFIIEPKVFGDARGFFCETFRQDLFEQWVGKPVQFVQENHSHSAGGVLRGLHYQIEQAQGKLVRVTSGEVFDVAVDMRRSSATFGQWVGEVLSADNHRQLWVPPGFAHGFLVLSATADFVYKTTDYYAPAHEAALRWDDATVGITWPACAYPIQLSDKDLNAATFAHAATFA